MLHHCPSAKSNSLEYVETFNYFSLQLSSKDANHLLSVCIRTLGHVYHTTLFGGLWEKHSFFFSVL